MRALSDLFTLLPELILTVTVLTVITVDLFLPRATKWLLTPITVFGLVLAGVGCALVWGVNETVFAGFYVVDDLSVFFKAATIVIGILAALFAPPYLLSRRLPLGEFNAILLFSLIGMCVLASSSDLITLFLGLELMVMPSYLLAGFHKTDRYSNEGGLKYFLLGSFASAILLLGISWAYGLTGSTRIEAIGAGVLDSGPAGLVAIGLLTVGGTFKIAAVPFHYWTPDAYQGAPTPITALMASCTLVSAFGAILRVFYVGLENLRWDWRPMMWGVAIITMIAGAVIAITQTDVKRLLAYSSIAHAGFLLLGVIATSKAGLSA
ncbi:MAG TPA: NADH-quinone oxidoreductase subunit N, partial [Candidatus Binatia bacterium]|nr:NADH-quinone oxidoreductase subunit N [Candidatus Binatia bacterium]